MTRAPFVMAKARRLRTQSRGVRHIDRLAVRESQIQEKYGTEAMGQTAEIVGREYGSHVPNRMRSRWRATSAR